MTVRKHLCYMLAVLALSLPVLALPQAIAAKELSGSWLGELEVPGAKLHLLIKMTALADGTLSATIESPDQGGGATPCTSAKLEQNNLTLEVKPMMVTYRAIVKENGTVLDGTFTQGGNSLPLVCKRATEGDEAAITHKLRPQDPQKPYPYNEEEVVCRNAKAGINLAGTLTLPKSGAPFAAVVMITGSGPQDRNEEICSHRPFLVIADYLTRLGIAVLRLDDRGVGASEGKALRATSTSVDYGDDIAAGVAFLRTRHDIDKNKIGLIGHSEGGMIAPMLAAQDKKIAFIVMMAGLGTSGLDCLVAQQARGAELDGVPAADVALLTTMHREMFNALNAEPDNDKASQKMTAIIAATKPKLSENMRPMADQELTALPTYIKTWFRYFMKFDPAPYLQKVACPVLAMNGDKDCQVIAKDNLPAIEKWLKKGGNTDVTIKALPSLNHLFQTAKTGAVEEYFQIDETTAPVVLETIGNWILKHVKK